MSPASRFSQRARPPTVRSVRLVLVVCCVLAGVSVLLAAPTAAAPTVENVTAADDESWIGLEDDHEVAIEASGIETTDGPATVTVELAGWPDDALVGDPDVEVLTDGVDIAGEVGTDGTTVSFDVNDTTEAVIDLEAELDVTLEHPLDSSFDGSEYSVDVEIEGSDGADGAKADVTIRRLSYLVDGDERFPPSTAFVYRNQTVTVANLEPETDYTLFEFDPDEGTLGDPIESVTPGSETTATLDTSGEAFEPGWYLVYDGEDVVPTAENAFQIQRHEIDATPGDETVDSTGDGAETTVTIDSPIRSTAFDVTVTSGDMDADDLFEVFEGETNADVEYDDDETSIVIRDVEAGDGIPMTFEPILEATYGFEFEAADTGAGDDTSVTVEEREIGAAFGSDRYEAAVGSIAEIDLSLEDTDEAYLMIGGDSGDDGALTNYFDILHVEGGTTIRINTRLLGTDVPSEEVYDAEGAEVTSYLQDPDHDGFDDVSFGGGADYLSEFRSEIGVGALPRPFQPDRLRLVAGGSGSVEIRDDGVPDFERPLARSNLVLTDTDGFGNVTTYVAPEGSANEFEGADDLGDLEAALTERRTVAKGDRIVFEIEADGITGLVSWLDGRLGSEDIDIDHPTLSTLLEFPDGFVLEGEQANAGRNERVTGLDLDGATDGDLFMLHEPMTETGDQLAIERYYLVVDTRDSGPFDGDIEPGDEYRFRFGYDAAGETDWFDTVDHDAIDPNGAAPHFPYFPADADNVSESRLVTVSERSVGYESVDGDGRPVLRNAETATLSGWTNLAPGTDVSVQLSSAARDDGDQFSIADIEIGDDGRFELTRDLSAFDPGEGIEIEFYVDQRLLEKRSGVVIGTDEPLTEYRIAEHEDNLTVRDGDRFDSIPLAVENVGHIPGEGSAELAIENETERASSLELDSGAVGAVALNGTIDLEPGTYNYTITTDDDEVSGLITVEEPEPDDGSSSGDSPQTDGAGTDDLGEGDQPAEDTAGADEPEESEEEESPDVFGVGALPFGARHAVGGAALVGAVHVLGYWV